MLFCLYHISVQRLGNPKMRIVYCSISNKINSICDTAPLDKFKYHSVNKPALLYITWGLIQDLKTETQEITMIFQISKFKNERS